MKNVRLQKPLSKVWVLIVEDEHTKSIIALTSEELWAIRKIISDNENEIMEEIGS